jgi:hypothetical protein
MLNTISKIAFLRYFLCFSYFSAIAMKTIDANDITKNTPSSTLIVFPLLFRFLFIGRDPDVSYPVRQNHPLIATNYSGSNYFVGAGVNRF